MAEYLSPAVYIEEIPSGNKPIQAAGTSTGAVIGIAQKGPVGEAVRLVNYAEFDRTFGTFVDEGYLAFAVEAFFKEGGPSCYVTRTCHYVGGVAQAKASTRTLLATDAVTQSIKVSAASAGAWGDDIAVSVTLTGTDTFTLTVQYEGTEVESITELSMDTLAERYVETAIDAEAKWIVVEDVTGTSALSIAARRPAATATFQQFFSAVADPLVNDNQAGEAGDRNGLVNLTSTDFIGDEATGNGLHAFDKVRDIRIVAVPEGDEDVHGQGMAYCANRGDCFYVADTPEGAVTATEILNYKTAQGSYAGGNALNSKYGALYGPWIHVSDPRSGVSIKIPPSGAVAGRYAATDTARGVHKAPAGTVDGLFRTVSKLAAALTAADQELLNPKGINVLRRFSGLGNVIWGARTVSSDPEWRYLNVRRLFLMLETSIEESTSWIVFDPNDPALWKSIVRTVSAFLKIQWLQGALVGETQEQAFYVKCDEETNPQESIDLGRVITEIGVAPSKPAEFVIFRISQFAGGSEVSE